MCGCNSKKGMKFVFGCTQHPGWRGESGVRGGVRGEGDDGVGQGKNWDNYLQIT